MAGNVFLSVCGACVRCLWDDVMVAGPFFRATVCLSHGVVSLGLERITNSNKNH